MSGYQSKAVYSEKPLRSGCAISTGRHAGDMVSSHVGYWIYFTGLMLLHCKTYAAITSQLEGKIKFNYSNAEFPISIATYIYLAVGSAIFRLVAHNRPMKRKDGKL